MGLRAATLLLLVVGVTAAAAAAAPFAEPKPPSVCVNEGTSKLRVATCTANFKKAADKFRAEIARLTKELNTARADLTAARADLDGTKASLRAANAAKTTCQAELAAERNKRTTCDCSSCEKQKTAVERERDAVARERDEIQALQLACVVERSDCWSNQLGRCQEDLRAARQDKDDCLAARGTCLETDLPACNAKYNSLAFLCDNVSEVTPGYKQQAEAAERRLEEILNQCCSCN